MRHARLATRSQSEGNTGVAPLEETGKKRRIITPTLFGEMRLNDGVFMWGPDLLFQIGAPRIEQFLCVRSEAKEGNLFPVDKLSAKRDRCNSVQFFKDCLCALLGYRTWGAVDILPGEGIVRINTELEALEQSIISGSAS